MKKYFEYLDWLRESGAVNMLGAGAYLEAQFRLSKTEARRILVAWMETYSSDKTAAERAAAMERV